jgi:hypothetical protein
VLCGDGGEEREQPPRPQLRRPVLITLLAGGVCQQPGLLHDEALWRRHGMVWCGVAAGPSLFGVAQQRARHTRINSLSRFIRP